jgi:hypothetical protein
MSEVAKSPEVNIATNGEAHFDAFISYSHQSDDSTAPILQKSIESALAHFLKQGPVDT